MKFIMTGFHGFDDLFGKEKKRKDEKFGFMVAFGSVKVKTSDTEDENWGKWFRDKIDGKGPEDKTSNNKSGFYHYSSL
jgi:hypothetical protein